MLIVFSISDANLVSTLLHFSRIRLTTKQKQILCYVLHLERKIVVTTFVAELSTQLQCSKTTIWNNLAQLKAIGLLSYGNRQSKGSPVQLTSIGVFLSQSLEVRG
ncbi:HTH domain-containing protein [Candidatus Woesearchaeota archaeon]|nr:HTH domain-containing protein [Candidatus Woesearchaeota archaeon]